MSSHEAFKKKFNTQAKCLAYLEELRWGQKRQAICVHCGSGNRMTKRSGMTIWHCNKCNLDTTVLLQSPMEHSRLPLVKWFQIIHLMLYTSKNASQIARQLKIPYKSMWYCSMRIRCFMISPDIGPEIATLLRDDLRKFIKERSLSEKEGVRVEGFDRTLKEILSTYDANGADFESVMGYLIRKMKLRYRKLSRKYAEFYVAEHIFRNRFKEKRNLFGFYLQNAFSNKYVPPISTDLKK